jgi:hypothetical protein
MAARFSEIRFARRSLAAWRTSQERREAQERRTDLVANPPGLHLVGEDLGSGLFGFGSVDVFHEHPLILEDVTLGLHVEGMVAAGDISLMSRSKSNRADIQMLVNLSGFTILAQETTENPLPPHPEDLGGHAGFSGTLAFTGARVPTLALRSMEVAGASGGVDDGGLDDDTSVLDEFFDVRAGVGVANLGLF